MVLGNLFLNSNNNIHETNIFNYGVSYTAYADGKTFFLKDLDSTKNVLKMLDQFYIVCGLCPNWS